MTATLRPLRTASRAVLDALLPPRCLACGTLVAEPGALCAECFGGVEFLVDPVCNSCGDPFELPMEPGALCAACIDAPPPWRRARAVFEYDGVARDLILRFKHADRTDSAPAFARWMMRAARPLVEDADLIAPVPLHRGRLMKRRYNQAALLARQLDRLGGVPAGRFAPNLLLRARKTPPQEGMGRAARRRNVRSAFVLSDPDSVGGRVVLLVDDVMTTGATVGECARVLRQAGAAAVDVVTLARVVLSPEWQPDTEPLP
ncbi:double zinc ribbon domain-containing protein [Caenispirillum salinarum]|uniref:double zinc ribbon domain-containing protein n=1 Tax=Caenispirillum salinarum TaxID=859058 RepID=UPI0038511949